MQHRRWIIVFVLILSVTELFAQTSGPGLINEHPEIILIQQTVVYETTPAYSLLKGEVVYGKELGKLDTGTEIIMVKEKIVNKINVWWYIEYEKDGEQQKGWIQSGRIIDNKIEYNVFIMLDTEEDSNEL